MGCPRRSLFGASDGDPEPAEQGAAAARDCGVDTVSFRANRRLVTTAVRAGRRIVPLHGLLEVDVTEARHLLAEQEPPLSLTAFVVASVARAAAAHPGVHAYRDWRGRLMQHRHVAVQTLIEVPTTQGSFGLVHVVRDTDLRGVPEISSELRAAKADPDATATGRPVRAVIPVAGRVPGLFRAMYAAMGRSIRLHLQTGTAHVTAVGMFAGGGGFRDRPTDAGFTARRRGADSVSAHASSTTTSWFVTYSTSPSPLTVPAPRVIAEHSGMARRRAQASRYSGRSLRSSEAAN
jgi:hypothetical protein